MISKWNAEASCEQGDEHNDCGRWKNGPNNEADQCENSTASFAPFRAPHPQESKQESQRQTPQGKGVCHLQESSPPTQEKPVATKPNVAKNIAKSDIQSKESLLCFVREITESERRNNRLSIAGPATTANPRRFNGRRTRCTRRSSVKNVAGAGFHSPVGDSSATTLATGMRITTGSRVSLGSNSFGASNSDRSTSCIFFLPQRTDTPPVLRL